MIIIPIASNQNNQGKGWENLGAATCLGPHEKVKKYKLKKEFLKFIYDDLKIKNMSKKAINAVDCNGTKRIIDQLIK